MSPISPRNAYPFPDPRTANAEGVVAVGGPFDAARLLEAYGRGIFPWNGDPVRWYSPDPRSVFWRVRLPRRLPKLARQGAFRISFDRAFADVISACAAHHREAGVWITETFERAYVELHEMGFAHSVEIWQGSTLVGGLYGVLVGGIFSGESMFYRQPNASKIAFAALAYHLRSIGTVVFDSQVINEHTHQLGAVLISRHDFLQLLDFALDAAPIEPQSWTGQQSTSLQGTPLEQFAHAGDTHNAQAPKPLTTAAPRELPALRFWSFHDEPHHAEGHR